ncbi:cytochrome c1 [Sphingomonas sp.]|uniref:cytochrome c1 n=1 Tax=Sphingomonas sp. TaxID=28214 RepID=UPI001D2BF09B|nr:cytochrome c1 [Sphingomonas sp.]MBX9795714.1 cytochrome c1 [Sphingomonas sp.]
MLRFFAAIIGLVFIAAAGFGLAGSVYSLATEETKESAVEVLHKHPEHLELASNGLFGKVDEREAQRGFQVYQQVCANCHSLTHVAFRDLKKIGYTDAEVKKIAADWSNKAPTFDPKTGERGDRPNTPADKFPTVYYPGQGNPPDLSLITKARHDGAAYVYSLLTGYREMTEKEMKEHPDAKTPDGLYFNPYFANLNLAMPPPLMDGAVTYADGTKSTVKQNAKDVAAFLVWAAEPELGQRHGMGVMVIVFLLVATVFAYFAYLNIWRNVKH